jgi:hypothetical protein
MVIISLVIRLELKTVSFEDFLIFPAGISSIYLFYVILSFHSFISSHQLAFFSLAITIIENIYEVVVMMLGGMIC